METKKETTVPQRAYKTRDVATMLALSESQVKRLIADGEIASVLIGSSRRVTERQIDAYLRRLEGDEAA